MQGVGVIGAGVIFNAHAKAWDALADRARCFAVAEIDESKRAEATRNHFLPVDVADYRELLARDDVAIICVCTPPFLHEEIVCDALAAGKFVLCEKPLAPTLAAVDRIVEVASKHPGRLSTIHQLRFGADMQRLLWLVRRGYLGTLTSGHATRRSPLMGSAAISSGWWGRWNVSGGGIVMTQFIHHLDQLLCIFGRPRRVEATMATECQPIESEDSFAATIAFENGATVTCEGTLNAQEFEWELGVVGDAMAARLPWTLGSSDTRRLRNVEAELAAAFSGRMGIMGRLSCKWKALTRRPAAAHAAPVNSHEPYFAAVLDALDAGEPLPVPAEEARAAVELCTAIYTSALTGRPVDLPLTADSPFYEGVHALDYRNARAAVA